MKKNLTLFIALYFFWGTNLSQAQNISECIDLFIWAGQSNAQGWKGDARYYPSDPDQLDASIRLYYDDVDNKTSSNGQWISMQKQGGRFPAGHFGPEVSFSRELKKSGFNPAIFKYTNGATSIYEHWKLPGQHGMYDDMVAEFANAVTLLVNEGHKVTVKGFIWIQGESDTKDVTHANAYYNNLLTIINDLREKIVKNEKLTTVLGMDEQFPLDVENAMEIVLEAHHRLDDEDENIVFTSMYGLQKADATHLTPAGLVAHGERIFAAFDSTYLQKLSLPEIQIAQGDSVLIFGKYQKNAGIYIDTLVTANGCDSINIQKLAISTETSSKHLTSNIEPSIVAYPNPFFNLLNIKFANTQKRILIEISDLSGRQVLKQEARNSQACQIHTQGMQPSIYFMHIQTEEVSKTLKIIKK